VDFVVCGIESIIRLVKCMKPKFGRNPTALPSASFWLASERHLFRWRWPSREIYNIKDRNRMSIWMLLGRRGSSGTLSMIFVAPR
jgi:hypothetical protein